MEGLGKGSTKYLRGSGAGLEHRAHEPWSMEKFRSLPHQASTAPRVLLKYWAWFPTVSPSIFWVSAYISKMRGIEAVSKLLCHGPHKSFLVLELIYGAGAQNLVLTNSLQVLYQRSVGGGH